MQSFILASEAIAPIFILLLVGYICGEGSGALTSLMVAVVVPVFNVFAVFSLEIFRGNSIKIGKLVKGIIKKPTYYRMHSWTRFPPCRY